MNTPPRDRHPGGWGDRRSRDPAIRDLIHVLYEIPDAMVPDPSDRHRSGMTFGWGTAYLLVPDLGSAIIIFVLSPIIHDLPRSLELRSVCSLRR